MGNTMTTLSLLVLLTAIIADFPWIADVLQLHPRAFMFCSTSNGLRLLLMPNYDNILITHSAQSFIIIHMV